MTSDVHVVAPRSSQPTSMIGRRTAAGWVRTHPFAAFMAGAFALSWAYWIPDALTGGHWSHYPGLVGPALSAIAVSAVCGHDQRRALRARTTRWRVAPRWYAAALAPLVAAAATIAVAAIVGHAPSLDQLSRMNGLPAVGWIAVTVTVFVVDGFGEEIGWRAFAWPQLRQQRPLIARAAVLTIPWALWHLPLLWIDSGFRGFAPVALPGFVLSLFAGAVVLGWLFDKTAAVAVVALFHTMLNMTTSTAGAGPAQAVVSIVVIAMALAIIRSDYSNSKPQTNARHPARANRG